MYLILLSVFSAVLNFHLERFQDSIWLLSNWKALKTVAWYVCRHLQNISLVCNMLDDLQRSGLWPLYFNMQVILHLLCSSTSPCVQNISENIWGSALIIGRHWGWETLGKKRFILWELCPFLCPNQTCLVGAILDSLWLSRPVVALPVPWHLNIACNFGYLWWIALQFGTHTHCNKTQWGIT